MDSVIIQLHYNINFNGCMYAYVFSIQAEKKGAQTSGLEHGTLMFCCSCSLMMHLGTEHNYNYNTNHVHLINYCKNIIIQIGINEPVIKDFHRGYYS